MTEKPNICYIFEKLRVQGCQIWHSHLSIPFNSATAHSTRLYVIISVEIPGNYVDSHKSIFDGPVNSCFPSVNKSPGPGAYLGRRSPLRPTSNTPKMAEDGPKITKMHCGTFWNPLPRPKINKLTKLGRCDRETIELANHSNDNIVRTAGRASK